MVRSRRNNWANDVVLSEWCDPAETCRTEVFTRQQRQAVVCLANVTVVVAEPYLRDRCTRLWSGVDPDVQPRHEVFDDGNGLEVLGGKFV